MTRPSCCRLDNFLSLIQSVPLVKQGLIFLCLLVYPFSFAHAEVTVLPEVLVTINKSEEPQNASPFSVEVLSSKDIQSLNPDSIAAVLKEISGIDVTTQGTPGDTTNIRMRGSDRDEVLVLLDGVSILGNGEARADFLGMIPVDQIERIEVLKGSQGLLYGSEAVGGVINIITKKTGQNSSAGLKVSGGNLSFASETATASIAAEKTFTSLAFTREDKGGRGANDRFSSNWFSANLSHEISDKVSVEGGFHFGLADQELRKDQIITFAGGALQDYVVNDSNSRNRTISTSTHIKLVSRWNDHVESELKYGLHFLSQRVLNSNQVDTPVDETGAALAPSSQHFLSRSFKHDVDLLNHFTILDRPESGLRITALAGYNLTFDHLDFINNSLEGDVGAGLPATSSFPTPGAKSGRTNNAFYIDNKVEWKNWITSGGFRYDHNSTYGGEFSPRAGLSYRIAKTNTRFFGSYSEGFHAPTIAEFFDTKVGGTVTGIPIKGQAELTRSFEAGFQQFLLGDKVNFKSLWYLTKYDKLLDIVEVVNGAKSWGIESDLKTSPCRFVDLGLNYAYNKATANATGLGLIMRPHHHLNATLTVRPLQNLEVGADYHYTSSKLVPRTVSLTIGDFPVVFHDAAGHTATQLAGFATLDLSARYKIPTTRKHLDQWEVFAKATNILNKKYEENFGYDMPGFQFAAGTRLKF